MSLNLLNLPQQITLSNGKKTIFTYDAFGTKLKTQEYTGTTLTRTSDYLGSVQYLNGTAQFAATNEGRVYNNSGTYRYDYFMKDQVGNIRLTYTANGTGVTVLQRDEYYPFGNTFDSYLGSGGANAYKFNGMEFHENDLNTFDFHARMYDPQIGRSFQPDPHADSYVAKSPFSFLANNPISFTDPTGMDEVPWDDVYGGGGDGFDMVGSGISSVAGSWSLHAGGNTNVSKKWMGLVHDAATNRYFYKGKPVSEGFAKTLRESGRISFYSPNVKKREIIDWYHKSGGNPRVYDGYTVKFIIEPSDAQGGGGLVNNSSSTIYYKPDNSSGSYSDWGAYPLKPGGSTNIGVDAINVNGKVFKVRDGYNSLGVNKNNKVTFDYPWYTTASPRVFQVDNAWLNNMLKNPDGTGKYYEWPSGSGSYVPDTQWWNIFNPTNQILDPRH